MIGREALLLMGVPIHRLDLSRTTEAESLLHGLRLNFNWQLVPKCSKLEYLTKEMHGLAGNAMSVRAIMAIICVALSLTCPCKLAPG